MKVVQKLLILSSNLKSESGLAFLKDRSIRLLWKLEEKNYLKNYCQSYVFPHQQILLHYLYHGFKQEIGISIGIRPALF